MYVCMYVCCMYALCKYVHTHILRTYEQAFVPSCPARASVPASACQCLSSQSVPVSCMYVQLIVRPNVQQIVPPTFACSPRCPLRSPPSFSVLLWAAALWLYNAAHHGRLEAMCIAWFKASASDLEYKLMKNWRKVRLTF